MSNYYVDYRREGATSWTNVYGGKNTNTPLSITPFAEGRYQLRLQACDEAFGKSQCSGWRTVTVTLAALPARPRSITSASSTDLTVRWEPVSANTDYYDLDQRMDSGSWTNVYDSGKATSVVASVSREGRYQFRVRACRTVDSTALCSNFRESPAVTLAKPAAIPELSVPANDADGQFTVTWNALTNVSYYFVQEKIGSTNWTTLRDHDTNRSDSTTLSKSVDTSDTYAYKVAACNALGCTDSSVSQSVAVALAPGTPGKFSLPAIHGEPNLTISWGKATGRVTAYELQSRFNSGGWTPLFKSNALSFQAGGLNVGEYAFRVRACNRVGSFENCPNTWRTSPTLDLALPAGAPEITLPSVDIDGDYEVAWSRVGNASYYTLEEKPEGGAWTEVTPDALGDRFFRAQNKTDNRYYYRVSACNGLGCSTPSATASVIVSPLAMEGWALTTTTTVPDAEPGEFWVADHDASTGTLPGEGGVSGGQASYQIPIQVPPGRANRQPAIVIEYTSQGGNDVLGMGFALSVGSAISRCPQTVVHDGKNAGIQYSVTNDRLCLDGQRLILVSGVYGTSGAEYRTEIDRFARITQSGGNLNDANARFKVERKDGLIAFYGIAGNSRVIPARAPAALTWLIAREEDRSAKKNSVIYTYRQFGRGEVRLDNIAYTGQGTVKGGREVRFLYEARPDIASSFLAGGETAQTRRLQSIVTYVGSSWVQITRFHYSTSAASGRSLLTQIEHCSDSSGQTLCKPATRFQWFHANPQFELEKVGYRNTSGEIEPQLQTESQIEKVVPHGDVNGDGSADWPTWFADAEGVYQGANTSYGRACRRVKWPGIICADGDLNRDGRTDVWRFSNGEIQLSYDALSTDGGRWISTGIFVPSTLKDGPYNIADYNADGWPDLVVSIHEAFFDGQPRRLVLYTHSGNAENPFSGNGITLFTYHERTPQGGATHFTNDVQLMGDMNGDGLPDMMTFSLGSSVNGRYAKEMIFTRLDAQGRPTFTDRVSVVAHRNTAPGADELQADLRDFDYFMDVNGDGRADWLAWINARRLWLSLNRGDGSFGPWQDLGAEGELAARIIPVHFNGEPVDTYTPKYAHALRQFDWDADGRPELLVPEQRLVSICLTRRVVTALREICGDDIYKSYNVRAGETLIPTSIDLASFDSSVYQYKAFHFVESADGSFSIQSRSTPLVASANQSVSIDGFGNGLNDLVFIMGCVPGDACRIKSKIGAMADIDPGVYINRNTGAATAPSRYEPIDMLQSVQDGLGVSNEWAYRPLASRDSRFDGDDLPFYEPDFDYLAGLSAQARQQHFHFSSSMYVVAEHRSSNGLGNQLHARQFRYKGAMFNWQGRGGQGFRTIIVEDLANNLRSQSDFHQVFPLAGKLHRSRQWQLDEAVADRTFEQRAAVKETQYNWQFWAMNDKGGSSHYSIEALTDSWSVASTPQPYNVSEIRQTRITRHLDPAGRAEIFRIQQNTDVDEFGNVIVSNSYYEEPGNSHRVVEETTRTYIVDVNTWWLDRLDRQTTTQFPVASRNGVEIVADTDIQHTVALQYEDWDSQARKPRTLITTPSSGIAVTVTSIYNDFGQPTRVTITPTGETGRRVTTTYTEDGYFVETETNALGHVVRTHTDPRYGLPLWVEDANGQRTSTQYDSFGRVVEVSREGIAPPIFTSLQWCQGCDGVSQAVTKRIKEQAGTPRIVTYHDKLGRVIQTHTEAFEAGRWIVTSVEYNARGHVAFESVPAFDSPSNKGTAYTRYDALGRLTEKTVDQTRGQTLTTTYLHDQGEGFTTEIQAGDLIMSRQFNGLGQLIETVDALGGVTRYAYDGAGNPIVLEDANGERIVAQYNALGQKVYVDDPNMGRKTFTYTGFGEVNTETDANSTIKDFDYDALGRQVLRKVNGVREASWRYDTAANGKGLLARESREDADFSKTYTYDSFSRPVRVTTHIEGESFTTDTQYDSYFGRVKGLTYPNGLTLAYGFNGRGYATAVTNAASGYVYRELTGMDAFGQWEAALVAAGTVSSIRQFSGATGRLLRHTTSDLIAPVYDQHYSDFDQYGNLTQTETAVPSLSNRVETEDFQYDDLHRLIQSSRSNGPTIRYDYDAVGNFTLKDDYATLYEYDGAKPNAVSRVTLKDGSHKTFSYDNNGNRTHENGQQTLWYNAFNKPSRIAREGTTLVFAYGADLSRYQQINETTGTVTFYVDKLFEQITESSGKVKHRFYIEDIAVLTLERQQGRYTDPSIGFTHRDRLGSTVAMTDHLGGLKETHGFDPFGKPRTGENTDKLDPVLLSALSTRGFTDHEHLDGVQLIHMNGRGYDYNLGRFLSVDPVIQAPGNSQSLNPYSYILNNPLSGTDPTGYCSAKTGTRIKTCEDIKITTVDVDTGEKTSKTVSVNTRNPGDLSNAIVNAAQTAGFTQINGVFKTGGSGISEIGTQNNRPNVGDPFENPMPGAENQLAQLSPYTLGQADARVREIEQTDPAFAEQAKAWQAAGVVIVTGGVIYVVSPIGAAVVEAGAVASFGEGIRGATEGLVDPKTIRFTQDSIKSTFKDGRSLKGLIDDLRTGHVSANNLPPIRTFERDGKTFSLDNRRLKAFQEAGVPIRTIPATAEEVAREAFKFTSKNGGESIRVRGGGL